MEINYKELVSAAKREKRVQIGRADSLSKRSKFIQEQPINRFLMKQQAQMSQSISDILENAHCMGFLSEDDVRMRMRELSALLNAPRAPRK